MTITVEELTQRLETLGVRQIYLAAFHKVVSRTQKMQSIQSNLDEHRRVTNNMASHGRRVIQSLLIHLDSPDVDCELFCQTSVHEIEGIFTPNLSAEDVTHDSKGLTEDRYQSLLTDLDGPGVNCEQFLQMAALEIDGVSVPNFSGEVCLHGAKGVQDDH